MKMIREITLTDSNGDIVELKAVSDNSFQFYNITDDNLNKAILFDVELGDENLKSFFYTDHWGFETEIRQFESGFAILSDNSKVVLETPRNFLVPSNLIIKMTNPINFQSKAYIFGIATKTQIKNLRL